tara:strand:+ start:310 stop:600 length:291 start_codon:yes stop_codon:yes gene_type:complete
MTLKDLRARVRMEMGNLSQEDLSDSEIDYHINEAQRLLCNDGALLRDMQTAKSIKDQERYSITDGDSTIQGILRVDYDDYKMIPVDYNDINKLDVT